MPLSSTIGDNTDGLEPVTFERLKNIIPAYLLAGVQFLLIGEPGTGKTSFFKWCCKKIGYDYLTISAASLRLEHMTGLAFPERDEHGKIERAKMAIFGLLETVINADKPTAVFLDDLGTGSEIIQKAMLHVFDGEINGLKVSEHVVLCGATNSREDMAGVRGLIEPLKSRFHVFFRVVADEEFFCTVVCEERDIWDVIPAFLMFEKGNGNNYLSVFEPDPGFKRHPSPRTWEFLSDIAKTHGVEKFGHGSYDDIIINGVIGAKIGRRFLYFIQSELPNMPSAESVLRDPEIWVGNHSMGVTYCVANQVARIVTPVDVPNAIKFCDKLPRMLQSYFMTLMREVNPANCRNQNYIEWKARPENKNLDLGYEG